MLDGKHVMNKYGNVVLILLPKKSEKVELNGKLKVD